MTPDFTWLFAKTLLGLLLVLGLAVILLRFILPRTRLGRRRAASWAQVLDRMPLDTRCSLMLVKILDRYFVLGATEHSVSTVTELTRSEGEALKNV